MTDRITFVFLFAVALAIRLVDISGPSTWTDEAATYFVCRMPIKELFSTICNVDVNPPLSYLFFWLFGKLNDSLPWMRSLSALFSAATVGLIFLFGKSFYSYRAGLLSSLLYCFLPLSVAFGRQVRYPAMFAFYVFAATFALISLLRNPTKKRAIVYSCLALCAAYIHYFSAFMFIAHIALLLLSWRGIENKKTIMLSIAILIIAYLPWTPVFIKQLLARHTFGFVSEFPYLALVPLIFVYFTQGWSLWSLPDFWSRNIAEIFNIAIPDWFPVILAIPFILCAAGGLFVNAKNKKARVGIGTYLIVPILSYLLISIWLPQFSPQYFLAFLPAGCIFCGAFWDVAFRRSIVLTALFIVIVFGISTGETLDYFLRKGTTEDWKGAVRLILEQWNPGDVVVIPNVPAKLCFDVYVWDGVRTIQVVSREKPGQKIDQGDVLNSIGQIDKQFKRAWVIDFYPRRFDPEQLIEKYLKSKGFQISIDPSRILSINDSLQLLTDERLKLRLYLFDRGLMKQYVPRSYDMAQHEKIMNEWNVSGVYSGTGDKRWTAREAAFLLYMETNDKVCMEGFAPSQLYPESVLDVTINLVGIPEMSLGEKNFTMQKDVRLMGMFWTCIGPIEHSGLIRLLIKCHVSFVPDTIFHDGDDSEKCLQLRRVWVESFQEANDE